MYRIYGAVLAMLFGLPAMLRAQQCSFQITIKVLETHNLAPVYPASVYVPELKEGFQTNDAGSVLLPKLCPGRYNIQIQAIGYEAHQETIDVTGSGERVIKVAHLQQSLGLVTVHDAAVKTILQDKENINRQSVLQQSGRTISELLTQVNGVTLLGNGGTIAKPVIHGLHSNRIVMLNNGVRQEDQQWGGEHAPNIDPFLANNITVIKGAASVRYGTDALGGVILVEPRALRAQPGWQGEVNMAAFSNNRMGVLNAMADYRLPKVPLTLRLQGTWKQGGNYRIPGAWVANTGLTEQNFSAAAAYRRAHTGVELSYSHFNTRLGIYRGAHTGNQADLLAAIASPTPLVNDGFTYRLGRPYQHVRHTLAKARLYADTRTGIWGLTYAYQHNYRQEYDIQRIEDNRAQLNLTLNTQTANLNLDHKALGKFKGQIGADGIYQENFFQPGDRLFIPNYRTLGGGAYLIERMTAGRWTLEGGLRYDHRGYEVFNPEGPNQTVVRYTYTFQNVSGTVGIRQQVTDAFDWSLTLSNAWRAPQANELFSAGLHHGAARIELGNKNLKPERSYNANLTAHYTWQKRLQAEVSVYTQNINNFIFLEPGPDVLTIRGYFKSFRYQQTNANLTGVDATIRYDWMKQLNSTLRTSFLRAWNRTANDWLILMPADRIALNSQYTRPLNRKVIQQLSLNVQTRYVFRQERIPENFDAIDFPRPPAGYFVADAGLAADVLLGKQPVAISLSANNLLNQRYRDYLDAFRYFLNQPGTDIALRLHIPFQSHSKP